MRLAFSGDGSSRRTRELDIPRMILRTSDEMTMMMTQSPQRRGSPKISGPRNGLKLWSLGINGDQYERMIKSANRLLQGGIRSCLKGACVARNSTHSFARYHNFILVRYHCLLFDSPYHLPVRLCAWARIG